MGNEVFLTANIPFGVQGLDLKRAIDTIPATHLARMTNVVRTEVGSLRLRPGQALLGQAAGAAVSPSPGVLTPGGRPFVVRETLKGIQFDLEAVAFEPALASDVRDLGVSMVRHAVTTFDAFDTFVDLFGDENIDTLGVLGKDLIAFEDQTDWETDAFRQAFATRVREVVLRYSTELRTHRVHHWQIWSDPDRDLSATGGADTRIEPDDYGKLLILVLPIIKDADPTATVVLGGISPEGHQFSRIYLRELYESASITAYRLANGANPWDAVAVHPYPVTFSSPAGLIATVNAFKSTMNTFGDRFVPLWITELGWNTSETSEPHQAFFVDRAYRQLDVLVDPDFPTDPVYVERVFWYRYHDDAAPALYGLRTSDLSRRKPSYDSYLGLGTHGVPPPPGAPPVLDDPSSDVHSIVRLNEPFHGVTSPVGGGALSPEFTRIVGIGRGLFHGTSGSFASATTGLSGEPLHLAAYRPPLSSESWVYVGDPNKNVKIRADGRTLPVGLNAPTGLARIAHDTEKRIGISDFETTHDWVGNLGTSDNLPGTGDEGGPPGAIPVPSDPPPLPPPPGGSPWPGIPPVTPLPVDPAEPDCLAPVSWQDRDRIRAEIEKYTRRARNRDTGSWQGPWDHLDEGHPDLKAAYRDIGDRLIGLYDRPKLLRCNRNARDRALKWIASLHELTVSTMSIPKEGWNAHGISSVPVGFTWTFERGPVYTIRPNSSPAVQTNKVNYCRWFLRLIGTPGPEADTNCIKQFPLGTVGVWDTPPATPTDPTTGGDVPPGTVFPGNGGGGGGEGSTVPGGESDVVRGKVGNAVKFTTSKPSGGSGSYYQYWGKNIGPIDLTRFPDGTPATDDDIIHVFIRVDRPDLINEVRLYFGIDGTFNNTKLPGTANKNRNAYVKAFRPGDFVNFVETSETAARAAPAAVATAAVEDRLPDRKFPDDDIPSIVGIMLPFELFMLSGYLASLGGWGVLASGLLTLLSFLALFGVILAGDAERIRGRAKARGFPKELTHGRDQWTEFGVIGVPLRRGDFLRIGDDPAFGWRRVNGLVIYVSVRDVADDIQITFDNLFLRGGSKLETIEPGLPNYDYRYIDVDPVTGEKSNPSPVQPDAASLPSIRQAIRVTPRRSGRGGAIQWFYRRGGILVNNWYFIGKNGTNGATFLDSSVSDIEALGSGTLEIDNDRPVTTISPSGSTVRVSPLSAIWGPISDMLIGCGDRRRKGHVYWCKPGEPDHWPPQNNIEVCPPSEELLTGFVYGSEAFVFSRERLYKLFPTLTGQTGQLSYIPTRCLKGPRARWMTAVGPQGIFFIADDGIYRTTGGEAISITDTTIEELFKGRVRNGYAPITDRNPTKLRLALHENALWFQYPTTAGDVRILVYDLIFDFWSAHSFARQTATLYSEGPSPASTLLLGGRGDAKVYVHSGTEDDGVAITANIRTGALDQGAPRRQKVYGDLELDLVGTFALDSSTLPPGLSAPQVIDTRDRTLRLAVLADDESAEIDEATVQPPAIKGRQILDVLDSARRRNISLDLTWSDPELNLYEGTIQYLIDEAVQRIRWESEETDHGIPAQQTPLYAYAAIRSTADVLLAMTTYREDGRTTVKTYTLEDTAEVKRVVFVPFEPTKGVAFRYRFTSAEPFQLYREESEVVVRIWGGQENRVKVFGDSMAVSPSEIRNVRGQT